MSKGHETRKARESIISLFREAHESGSNIEVDFTDPREASTSMGGYVLSVLAIKLLTGDDLSDSDVNACQRAVRSLQGKTNWKVLTNDQKT